MTETSKEYRLNKGRRVIDSCKTLEQIEVAWNYIDRMNRMDVTDCTELWHARVQNCGTRVGIRKILS